MKVHLLVATRRATCGQAWVDSLVAAGAGRLRVSLEKLPRTTAILSPPFPDVILAEYTPGEVPGAQMLLQASQAGAHTRVLVQCHACTDEDLLKLLRLGASGCIADDAEPAVLAKAVLCVAEGQVWVPRDALMRIVQELIGTARSASSPHPGKAAHLTPREREIMGLIGNGLTNKEIARQLCTSDKTVQTQLHRLYAKLGARGRYKAYAAFQTLQLGFVDEWRASAQPSTSGGSRLTSHE